MADYRKIRAVTWRSWLDGLPEEVYDKRDTAHIVRLMDALCGDNGVGYLRKRLLLKRLQTSLYETRYGDLDVVYSALFDLPRLKSEQYQYREDALLLWAEISEMDIKDARYRQRIWDYMLSFQYGGTLKGLSLAAQAAVGAPCQAVDGCIYYKSLGVGEESQGDVSHEPLNFQKTVDFNGCTILVMQDEPLTSEQLYNLSTITDRLRPVDVHYTFMTRKELMEALCFSDIDDDYFKPLSAEASSHWWQVVRTVTGRPDWSLPLSGNSWIEPNVPKEAPRQLLMNSQEAEYDFTPMVSDYEASSEHVGRYNAQQRRIFQSLAEKGAEVQKVALNALSQASSKVVSNGYYGDLAVIDGAYPSEYLSELTPFFKEVGRSHRFWSSDERGGSEWVQFELKRLVPVNHVSFAIFRKPVVVRLYYSSYEDGERVWRPAKDKMARPLSFRYPEWGSTQNGEMVEVDFLSVPVMADAVRIEVERLDIPHYSIIDDLGTFEEEVFPFSVEVSDVSIKYAVRSEDEFVQATYEDMFGNRVDTSLRVLGAGYAIDDSNETFWLSQPNVGESAVEYLVLKVADEPVRMNFVEIEAIYAGCQMNIYSSQADEPGDWVPYPQVHMLQSGRVELPTRKAKWVKLEFTTLCATPYDVSLKAVPVHTRRYPWDVRDYLDKRFSETYEESRTRQLLGTPDDAPYDDGSVQSRLGIEELYSYDDELGEARFYSTAGRGLQQKGDFHSIQDVAIRSFYGDEMATEEAAVPTPAAEAIGSLSPYYRFSETGEHGYLEEDYERTDNIAYVVGIKDVVFGFTGRVFTAVPDDTVYLQMQDGRFLDNVDGWEFRSDERIGVASERLNNFETVDVQCVYPFRTFEFYTNQKPAVEKFEHPSDMAGEWHGIGAEAERMEFGLSGTVLRFNPDSVGASIESEPKLTRSMAIAAAQVDVYPQLSGEWQFDCYDLFGEAVYSMRYQLEGGKWNTVGVNFVPMPGGNWWDRDYPFRVRLPLVGALAEGQHVFVPVVDFEAMLEDRVENPVTHQLEPFIDPDLNKLRLVFFNGVDVREIPVDITDNMELWFEVEQDLPAGKEANGSYDFDRMVFQGAYYLYFGGKKAADEPMRDWHAVWPYNGFTQETDASWDEVEDWYQVWEPLQYEDWDWDELRVGDDGTKFLRSGDMAVFDTFDLPDVGFMTMEVTLDDALIRVPDGAEGAAEYRFIIDYHDDGKDIQLYTYEKQLTFVIRERDGFESAFVSKEEDLLAEGAKSKVLLEWGRRGSAQVWEVDPDDPESTSVNPDNKNRRMLKVFVDSPVERECIENVYDETHYADQTKVY